MTKTIYLYTVYTFESMSFNPHFMLFNGHSPPAMADHCTEEDKRAGVQPFHESPVSSTHK